MSAVLLLGLRILAAVVLYGFVGWALSMLWLSLRQQSTLVSNRKVIPLTLTIQTGNVPTRVLKFSETTEIVIGRDPDCECLLEDSTISARHARLTFHHNQWWLEDLQSTNGTRLNDEMLGTATIVVSADQIRCGQTTLTVNLETNGVAHG